MRSRATEATMINPDWRFWSPSGEISNGGPSKWYIFDTDQRRMIVVTMDDEQDEEDLAIQHLRQHVDDLGPDVFEIHVSVDGDLLSTSSRPEDGRMQAVNYPMLSSFGNLESINIEDSTSSRSEGTGPGTARGRYRDIYRPV